jgi:hypothetical protein
MGNKKNIWKRIPTAKKMAAPADSDLDSPPCTLPKPRLTNPALRRANTSGTGTKVSDSIVQTSKKAVEERRPVTLADSDASMAVDDDNKDEVIEEVEEENGTWDEILDEED